MKTVLELPDEFRCPQCGEPLKLFHYEGKYVNGHPMLGCQNWGKCTSPWRDKPKECPWHVWVAFDKKGDLLGQRKDEHHVNMEAERARHIFLKKLIATLKTKYPNIFHNVFKLYQDWEATAPDIF